MFIFQLFNKNLHEEILKHCFKIDAKTHFYDLFQTQTFIKNSRFLKGEQGLLNTHAINKPVTHSFQYNTEIILMRFVPI